MVEEKTNGALTRVYTYGHDLISQDQLVGSDWSLSYYGYDGHGNVRFLPDPTGEVSDRYTYDAFGQLLTATGATANNYLYCGEQFDSELGLYYLRAQLMNPLTGRFWTADTYEGGNSDPVSLHKYLYANADPVNGMDPSGNMTSIGEALSAANLAVTRGVSAIRLGFQVGTKAGGRALWDVGKIVETQIVGRALGVGCGSGVGRVSIIVYEKTLEVRVNYLMPVGGSSP